MLFFAHFQVLEQLIELFRQSIETLQVIVAIFTIQQPVRVCHEGWKLVLHTEELIDWIIVPLPFFAFDLHLQKPLEHMGGKLLGRRLAIERVLAKLR